MGFCRSVLVSSGVATAFLLATHCCALYPRTDKLALPRNKTLIIIQATSVPAVYPKLPSHCLNGKTHKNPPPSSSHFQPHLMPATGRQISAILLPSAQTSHDVHVPFGLLGFKLNIIQVSWGSCGMRSLRLGDIGWASADPFGHDFTGPK